MEQINYQTIAETPSSADTSKHRVLIVGAGAAGLALASTLGHRFGKDGPLSVTLQDLSRVHVWKPLLHEVAAGSFDSSTDAIELMAHARLRHYRFRIGQMVGLDRSQRVIHVAQVNDAAGNEIIPPRVLGYDTLVIAIGSLSNDFGTPGVADHAITLDTLGQAEKFNQMLIDACLRANAQYEPLRPDQLNCAIVGAGATGVELAAELHDTMREIASYNLDNIDFERAIKITLIEAGPRILQALPESLARDTADLLDSLGVVIRTNTQVTEVRAGGVTLGDGAFLPAELIVWSAGIKAPEMLRELDGLETDRINRLVVTPSLQTTRDDAIFAIGDCAHCVLPGQTAPLPARAQVAEQQSQFMADAISRRIKGEPIGNFVYVDRGSLVALSRYKTFGVLFRGYRFKGRLATLAYRSLYAMHLVSLYGYWRVGTMMLARVFTRGAEPRVKLH